MYWYVYSKSDYFMFELKLWALTSISLFLSLKKKKKMPPGNVYVCLQCQEHEMEWWKGCKKRRQNVTGEI